MKELKLDYLTMVDEVPYTVETKLELVDIMFDIEKVNKNPFDNSVFYQILCKKIALLIENMAISMADRAFKATCINDYTLESTRALYLILSGIKIDYRRLIPDIIYHKKDCNLTDLSISIFTLYFDAFYTELLKIHYILNPNVYSSMMNLYGVITKKIITKDKLIMLYIKGLVSILNDIKEP